MSGAWLDPDKVLDAANRAFPTVKKKNKKHVEGMAHISAAVIDAVPSNSIDYRVFVSGDDFLLIKEFFNKEEPT